MMQQYQEAKDACGDALLLFRMGDFYELFLEDAKTAAQALGLTLTSRDKGEDPIPMAGFPHHQLESYLGKLIRLGFRVAVCEQVEDPRKAKGLVRREVTRIVTPGTLTDDALLDPQQSNYLAAILPEHQAQGATGGAVGIAWVDLSTGRFQATSCDGPRLMDEIARIEPSECLVVEGGAPLPTWLQARLMVTPLPGWMFSQRMAEETLQQHFGTTTLEGFGFGTGFSASADAADGLAVRAAGAVIQYLQQTQKSSLQHIHQLAPYRSGTRLEIDEATRRSLEITRTMRDGARSGSLLGVLDRTVSPMGARLLSEWLANPLTDRDEIVVRLDAVEELVHDPSLCGDLRRYLKDVYDLQRLLARVTTQRATPRDLAFIGRTLQTLPSAKSRLAGRRSHRLRRLEAELDLCPDIESALNSALMEDCPLTARDGGFIRDGHHAPLDEFRQLAQGGKQWIARYQSEESQRTGIPTLKVGYNRVFGYFIEITNAQREKVPADFIRKQTLKNAERYITPQLKEYEEKVLTADDQAKELEYELFVQLRDQVQRATARLQRTADVLAQLDVLTSLAELARQQHYVRPNIVPEPELILTDGRHPVLDITEPPGTFVPNDTIIRSEGQGILLITGPNMAGKSTYIRQVALITIMAQMGSFVPARQATIGVADQIFARVGASDQLARGHSTFMVEMTETARILNTATRHSLVVLDEIGRGTSTYDGISLAWAIVEYLHDRTGCRTLFATHYHELTGLASELAGVANLNVSVREWQDDIAFLHKIVPGAADKSYGIHVARLAGVPQSVLERSKQILSQLEHEHLDGQGKPRIAAGRQSIRRGDLQLTLFGPADHPILDVLRDLDFEALTPEVLRSHLAQWQRELRTGK